MKQRLRDAPEEECVEATAAVGSDHKQVCGTLIDRPPETIDGVALDDPRSHRTWQVAEHFEAVVHDPLALRESLLPGCLHQLEGQ
jgi:hypothetical protein